MDKKTVFRLVAIIIIIIALFVIAELLAKRIIIGNDNVDEGINNIIENQIITAEQKEREETFVDEIDNLVKMIQQKNYEEIYNKFPVVYKEIKYPTLTDFEQYMNEIVKEDSTVEIKEKYKVSKGYYAELKIDDTHDLHIRVSGVGTNNMTVMFDNIYGISSQTAFAYGGNTKLKVKYQIEYLNATGYVIEVENLSNKKLNIELDNVYLHNLGSDASEKINAVEKYSSVIDVNQSTIFEVKFQVTDNDMFEHEKIHIDLKENGNVREIELDMTPEDDWQIG